MVNAPTVISTFAGCGGSSLGYKMAGFHELLAVEWDDNAVETFKLNFPEVPVYHGDIAKLTGGECMKLAGGIKPGELDVLDGSPPCQGFSTAGKRKYDDPRNSLFMEYARLLSELQPKVFVMENVTGMVKGHMKQAYLKITATLRACGYRVRGEVMNAMYYGVPQSRRRVIIIGVRNDINIEPTHPKPETKPISVESVFQEEKGKRYVTFRNKGGGLLNSFRSSAHPLPTILKATGVQYYGDKETRASVPLYILKRCASYPNTYVFSGTEQDILERIGNSVPPNLMLAVASHVRKQVLEA
jgi:DNA (cytosine-5)-methyltransferase 1